MLMAKTKLLPHVSLRDLRVGATTPSESERRGQERKSRRPQARTQTFNLSVSAEQRGSWEGSVVVIAASGPRRLALESLWIQRMYVISRALEILASTFSEIQFLRTLPPGLRQYQTAPTGYRLPLSFYRLVSA